MFSIKKMLNNIDGSRNIFNNSKENNIYDNTGYKNEFEKLIEPIYTHLTSYVRGIVKNSFDADDVIQETLLSGYCNIEKLKDVGKFRQWIFKIAKNKARELFRKKQNDKEIFLDPDCIKQEFTEYDGMSLKTNHTDYFKTGISEEDVGNEIFDAGMNRLVDTVEMVSLIKSMKPIYRDVIFLRYYQDMPLTEIAEILGVTLSVIKIRHMRAKKMLREMLSVGE
ncbi:MAG: RNA polymerase sigma factor [Eubacteriales bacterium]|nr:RNA polymerase sigma factor [Eubacteriales bacterium]